jgi:hypothetical protein
MQSPKKPFNEATTSTQHKERIEFDARRQIIGKRKGTSLSPIQYQKQQHNKKGL